LDEENGLLKMHEKIFVGKPVNLDYGKVMSDVYSLNGQLSDEGELRERIFGIANMANMANGREGVNEKIAVGDGSR